MNGFLGRIPVAAVAGALFLPFPGAAQVTLGFSGGYHSVNVSSAAAPSGRSLGDTERRGGFSGGVLVAVSLSEDVGLRTGVGLVPRGFEQDQGGTTVELDLSHVEIPLLFTVNLGERRVTPVLHAGPWVSFEARCEITVGTGSLGQTLDCDEQAAAVSRKGVDFGLALGGGLELGLSPRARALLDVSYRMGLRNVNDDEPPEDFKIRTRGLGVSLALEIPLGR